MGTIGRLSIGNADIFSISHFWVINGHFFWAKLTLYWAFCQSQKESLRMAVGRGNQKEHGIDGVFLEGEFI